VRSSVNGYLELSGKCGADQAVAYFQDILTLASHTTNRKTPREQTRDHQHDQLTMAPSSSPSAAVNSSPAGAMEASLL